MSTPNQQEDPVESGAVSLSEEEGSKTLIDPNPLPKSDHETFPAEENSAGEEEDDDEEGEGEDLDEETTPAVSSNMDLRIQPPIADPHVSPPLMSPTSRRRGSKRKKGKAKLNVKKQQAILEKLQTLRSNLKPISFVPTKLFHLSKHENLLKKLGLWEFVHINFETTIRVDLIAQLVVNYTPKSRCSHVDSYRIGVNRADLGRALKLPLRKEKSNAGGGDAELDSEISCDESIVFIKGLVSEWMLLSEDTWITPQEVTDNLKMIGDGHSDKVDWAGLLWFMVEKELKQGVQLVDCYYASHLQHLIKHQREELFLIGEEPEKDEVESDAHFKEVEDVDDEENIKDSDVVESHVGVDTVVVGPSTELTLGQDGEKEEEDDEMEEGGVKEVEMLDAESESDVERGGEFRESDVELGGEGEGEELWLLNGKTDLGDHFMQRCNGSEHGEEFVSLEESKDEEYEEMDGEEEVEEEAGNDFQVFPEDDHLGEEEFTGNFLQGMEANQLAFSSHELLHNASSVDARADVQHIASAPSFFNNSGKRVIEHDYHHTVNDNNKRSRINETWDNKPQDMGMCVEQMHQLTQTFKMLYEEREQTLEHTQMNQQLLLEELNKRDALIEHLHKAREDETQKKNFLIARLERELHLVASVMDGYKQAYKVTQKSFAEYREKARLPEEPVYKVAGPGGLVLSVKEIERRRLYYQQQIYETAKPWFSQLDLILEKTNLLDSRLIDVEANAKEVIALHSKRKIPQVEEEMPEIVEPPPLLEPKEAVPEEVSEPVPLLEPMEAVPKEVSEPLPLPEPEDEEEVCKAADHPPIPQTDEEVLDHSPIPQTDEAVLVHSPIPQTDEEVVGVAEPKPPSTE